MSEMYRIARKAAETMEGKCQPQLAAGVYRWCSWHRSQWYAGRAACVAMEDYILLGEQAIEDAEPLIRADERERTLNDPGYERRDRRLRGEALADLRDEVEALRRPPIPWVPIDDVLALLPEVSE